MNGIQIHALIVDPDRNTVHPLADALNRVEGVRSVEICKSVPEAVEAIRSREINAIYIDPLGLGIDGSSNFIFQMREEHPSVVFVLYYDAATLKPVLFTQPISE